MMEHTNKKGESKLKNQCSLPLTGAACVDLIITNHAVFSVDKEKGLTLVELAEGKTIEGVREITEADFAVADALTVAA